MHNIRRPENQFALIILAMAAAACLVGAVGAVNALAGDTLRAIPPLLLAPLYVVWWMIRSKHAEGVVDPLAVGFGLAWLAGLPVGCIAWYARTVLIGS